MPPISAEAQSESLSLRITEIFRSIQGEGKDVGVPTVFVRLTGCPLRCQYCDTAYAFSGGELTTLDKVVAEVASHATKFVTVTGGEPLAQPACLDLLRRLCDADYNVSLETSGALDIAAVDQRVSVVLDLKTPASRESHRNEYSNIERLKPQDQVKFVICNRTDYEWSRTTVAKYKLLEHTDNVLFSPSWGELQAGELADWILADELPVRMQIQLHKVLWGDVPGR